jgi:hypothetical protein
MTATANSRFAVVLSRCFLAAFFLATLCSPRRTTARAPQSTDAPLAQQPALDPAKKDPAAASPVAVAAAAAKAKAPKPHRVFTNDDFSAGSNIPVAPGAHRRLKQLNRCGRTCFIEVEKQALGWGYTTSFPRSTTRDMEDRLANDIEELQNDPKWQRLLLEMISAHIDSCLLRQKTPPPDSDPQQTPTRDELQDEEERMKNYRPPPGSNFNTASSALLAYRFSSKPDPLRASLMVHQYMDEIHRDCNVVLPPSNSDAGNEDP